MNYALEIIRLVLQIQNESSLKRLYGFTQISAAVEDKKVIAMSQPDKRDEIDNAVEKYRQAVMSLLYDVNSIQTLRFIYNYLFAHIRKRDKKSEPSQYQEGGAQIDSGQDIIRE